MSLRTQYEERCSVFLEPVAKSLLKYLNELSKDHPRIDGVSCRAKSADRFIQKAQKKDNDDNDKYIQPLIQIQDQIGARIITYYSSDVQTVSDNIVTPNFRHIEARDIVPDEDDEFGYFGKHFILLLPIDVTEDFPQVDPPLNFFELQIKTLFQHAWAEAGHDLGYKPNGILSSSQKRRMAFTAAQAWGADLVFNELFHELKPSDVTN